MATATKPVSKSIATILPFQIAGAIHYRESLLPAVNVRELRRRLRIKRAVDLSIAISLLPIAIPVVAIFAMLVRLTSKGPAFYSQIRIGQFGRPFTIFKLRSMYFDCEQKSGMRWSCPGDPRVTPLGKILRASHIDELPQLINVLRGEMSLVGPRPERPEIGRKVLMEIPQYDDRYAILPGVTGHSQVNLPPETVITDVFDKVWLDRFYMQRFSLGFDLLTLLRTGLKVIGLRRLSR